MALAASSLGHVAGRLLDAGAAPRLEEFVASAEGASTETEDRDLEARAAQFPVDALRSFVP
jgi:hypothetical protein